ncbi:hypothetical protein HDV00_008704, partial [Rhizophlyctis rosea]
MPPPRHTARIHPSAFKFRLPTSTCIARPASALHSPYRSISVKGIRKLNAVDKAASILDDVADTGEAASLDGALPSFATEGGAEDVNAESNKEEDMEAEEHSFSASILTDMEAVGKKAHRADELLKKMNQRAGKSSLDTFATILKEMPFKNRDPVSKAINTSVREPIRTDLVAAEIRTDDVDVSMPVDDVFVDPLLETDANDPPTPITDTLPDSDWPATSEAVSLSPEVASTFELPADDPFSEPQNQPSPLPSTPFSMYPSPGVPQPSTSPLHRRPPRKPTAPPPIPIAPPPSDAAPPHYTHWQNELNDLSFKVAQLRHTVSQMATMMKGLDEHRRQVTRRNEVLDGVIVAVSKNVDHWKNTTNGLAVRVGRLEEAGVGRGLGLGGVGKGGEGVGEGKGDGGRNPFSVVSYVKKGIQSALGLSPSSNQPASPSPSTPLTPTPLSTPPTPKPPPTPPIPPSTQPSPTTLLLHTRLDASHLRPSPHVTSPNFRVYAFDNPADADTFVDICMGVLRNEVGGGRV